jgi:hypothetical protein
MQAQGGEGDADKSLRREQMAVQRLFHEKLLRSHRQILRFRLLGHPNEPSLMAAALPEGGARRSEVFHNMIAVGPEATWGSGMMIHAAGSTHPAGTPQLQRRPQ